MTDFLMLPTMIFCLSLTGLAPALPGQSQLDQPGATQLQQNPTATNHDAAQLTVKTVAGNGIDGFSNDGGLAVNAAVSQPFGVVIGPDKSLYVCQVGSHVIRRIDLASGRISTVAGNGKMGLSSVGELATESALNEPYEVRFSSTSEMYFVQMKNHVISKVDRTTGRLVRIAGTAEQGFSGDEGLAIDATFNRPHSIALDSEDNVFVCDIGNHRIRKIDSKTGLISTFCGTGSKQPIPSSAHISGTALMGPRALDIDSAGDLILALREGNAIYRIQIQQNRIQHLAGTGKKGFSGDSSLATAGQLAGPKGVAVATTGDIYFADTENHVVRLIRKATGTLHTVVGDGTPGDGPDGPARKCRLNRPHSVCLDEAGNLYIGDSNNHRVRVLLAAP
ncbi:MAG: hypothetical protein ABJZ55_23135 [Fuerstiella sp.]